METLPSWLEELMGLPEEEARRAVAVMAGEKTPETAQRLRLVEEAGPPALRKEARRALYRLRAAGVEVPPPRPAPAAAAPTRALISWADGNGNVVVVCLVDRPSGGARVAKAVAGEAGIGHPEMSEMSPGQLGRFLRMLTGERLGLVECPVPYAQRLVADAAARGMPEDPGERAVAEAVVHTVGQPPAEVAHPVYDVLDPLAVKWDPDLLPNTPHLLETEEVAGWVFPPERVAGWVDRRQDIESSPLVVDPATRKARHTDVLRQAARELFPAESTAAWRRRLEDTAYYFYRRRQERHARLALAAALALEGVDVGDHPFLVALVEKSLDAAAKQRESGEESRIIIPRG